jgi:hypothetical protein
MVISAIMLIIFVSVLMLVVIMLTILWTNANMQSVIKLTGIIMSVIMLNVVTPCNAKADIEREF